MSRLYLGLDSSTQSLSAVVIEYGSGQIVFQHSLNFDACFPHYNTDNGVLKHFDPAVVHAPPLMWLEALDRLLIELGQSGMAMDRIAAVSGSAQQHATVYLKHGFLQDLETLNPLLPLHKQLHSVFSRETCPVWMDHSTTTQCQSLAESLGGQEQSNLITGSVVTERFSGAQIKKFAELEPANYAETAHIMLLSSFLSSLCCGHLCGIDYSDASGTNLLDINKKSWHQQALDACAEQLQTKLGQPQNPEQSLGNIHPYFAQRYGFNPQCQIMPWCGDNPSSAIGLGLIESGMSAISLGTSDTCFGLMSDLPENRNPYAHSFIAPNNDYMMLLCFRNGSLARDKIRCHFNLDWDQFAQLISESQPGNNGGLCLPWVSDEITPKTSSTGIHTKGLDDPDAAVLCRALVEGQMLAMSNHADLAGLHPTSIKATGGASNNREILNIMANVFDCPVEIIATSNSSALGAAMRAAHYLEQCTWKDCVAAFTGTIANTKIVPDKRLSTLYHKLKTDYASFEQQMLKSH